MSAVVAGDAGGGGGGGRAAREAGRLSALWRPALGGGGADAASERGRGVRYATGDGHELAAALRSLDFQQQACAWASAAVPRARGFGVRAGVGAEQMERANRGAWAAKVHGGQRGSRAELWGIWDFAMAGQAEAA